MDAEGVVKPPPDRAKPVLSLKMYEHWSFFGER